MQTLKKARERQNTIHQLLMQNGSVTLKEIRAKVGCSEATIRNDFREMEQQGLLKRVSGGAISSDSLIRNSGMEVRSHDNAEAKEKMAEYVATHLLKPGMIVTLDSGSTTLAIARKIADYRIPLTVITNSFPIMQLLCGLRDVTLYFAGGEYDARHQSFHDENAERMMRSLHSELCLIAPNGIDYQGNITNSGTSEHSIKRIMIENSLRTVIVADHSKLGKSELKLLASSKEIPEVVTDRAVNERQMRLLQEAGFRLSVAE
ncbi:MAG: DeoR/GlpR transcriptional regulator [Erysipelotrichaceae bacterium]|nr:DeoR/GlpR transcriptional regulator [Erysipelotrichaceae bacterium]